MYNIYINERLLKIIPDSDSFSGGDLVFRLKGEETEHFIKQLVTSFEQQPQLLTMVLSCSDIDKTWKTFKKSYTLIDAAGGMVLNNENNLLMIFRNNCWDLPKGKVEDKEETDTAALREVEEECGLHHLHLDKQLSTTYHTYELKGERILKRTYWFQMTTNEHDLTPQTDEGITAARWMNKKEIKKASEQSYVSIVALLKQHGFL